MIQEAQLRKQYPSELQTEDTLRLETQIRVYKKWLNCLLKQANAREITDVLDIFRDTKNLFSLCKYLLGQKAMAVKEPLLEDASHLNRAIAILERLYGHEIANVIQTAVLDISCKPAWNTEALVRNGGNWDKPTHATQQILTLLGLDALWILIVTVRAGTGPPSNLLGSVSSSGSTITRRSLGGSQSQSVNLSSVRTPCIDRWLISQDERLMAWCVAVTDGYAGLFINNFTHAWRDGLAFLAIVHQSRSDLFNYPSKMEKTANQNLSLAFHLATSEFATPRLLEPMDMHPDRVDARATATYVLEFRKAIERDRKRRSRGILEIQTASMHNEDETGLDHDAVNVTVLSRSSPTSTGSASDVTWLDDEVVEDSDEEGGQSTLPDTDVFASMIEATLAWLLAMEERFAYNDRHCNDATGQSDIPFRWSTYCKADLRKSPQTLGSQMTLEEKNDIDALLNYGTERLKKLHQKILIKVDEAMKHFEVHEDLTAHLSRRQMSVGRCLRLGNRIIHTCRDRTQLHSPSGDSAETVVDENSEERTHQARLRQRLLAVDPDVIHRQTALLSARWNNLCRINQTMGRRITNYLLRRQGMLLIAIRLQLEKLETEQAVQAELPIGPSIRDVKNQLEANRNLEEGIEVGEILAERLDNFIMLVPASTDRKESATRTDGLEFIVTELANRWSRLVDWVNTRYAKLQNALLYWRHFDEEMNVLSDWLTERSEEVARISATLNHSLKGRNKQTYKLPLNSTKEEGKLCTAHLDMMPDEKPGEFNELRLTNNAEMEAMEAYINAHEPQWAQLLASLDRRAQSVREACGGTEDVNRVVEAIVDQLVSQWSQLAEPQLSVDDWLDQCSKNTDILESQNPFEMKLSQMRKSAKLDVSDVEGIPTEVSMEKKRPAEGHLSVPKSPKVSCLDAPPSSPTGYRTEFETKAEELLNWLENSAEALELLTMDRRRALEATEQAEAIGRKVFPATCEMSTDKSDRTIKRISSEMIEWREIMKRVLTMGERYREELLETNENVEELDQLFDEVEERWAYLNSLLTEAERQVRITSNSKEFHKEVAKLLNRSESEQPSQQKQEVTSVSEECAVTADVVKRVLQSAHPPTDILETVQSKLTQLDNQLSKVGEVTMGPMKFNNPGHLEDELDNTNNILRDLTQEQSSFSTLVDQNVNILSAHVELNQGITTTTQNLRASCTQLRNRLSVMQDATDQLKLFMNRLEIIEKWLVDMRNYVDTVAQAQLPTMADVMAQYQETREALEDMDTLEATLSKVIDAAEQLKVYFNTAYSQSITDRLTDLQKDWDNVRELINISCDQLEYRLSDSNTLNETQSQEQQMTNMDLGLVGHAQAAPDIQPSSTERLPQPHPTHTSSNKQSETRHMLRVDIGELEQWMSQAKQKLAEFATIETQHSLDTSKQFLETLNQEIVERRQVVGALDANRAVNVADQAISETQILLTRAHFADLESALAAERERLRGAIYHLEDFRTLMSGEQRWFDSVASQVKRIWTVDYAITDELKDELESLDALIDEHNSEDEKRLETLAASLVDARIMASCICEELKAYKDRLNMVINETATVKAKLNNVLDEIQRVETETMAQETALKDVEKKLHDQLTVNTEEGIKADASDNWSSVMRQSEAFCKHLEQMIKENQAAGPIKAFLGRSLQICHNEISDSVSSVKQLVQQIIYPRDFDGQLSQVKHDVEAVEQLLHQLDITSISPTEIQATTEKAKDLLNTMNELKVNLDKLDKMSRTSSSTAFPEALMTELSGVHEQHRKVVMAILLALERLEDGLPLANNLDRLVTSFCEQVAGIEEIIDYLDTTDCPVSRRDMLQRIYTNLQKLCGNGSITEEIHSLMGQLKALSGVSSSKTIQESFKAIEERIARVKATKEAFHQQLEQIKSTPELFTADSCTHPPIPAPENPVITKIKPSVSQLIDVFLNPETPVSNTVRELAQEIRDHFKSIVLFNRYCLGTKTPLLSLQSDVAGAKSKLMPPKDYETTISERKALVQHFRQQRTYLGDRLRKLIVNAGDDGTDSRLQDLLSLQTAWHETNDKLDRRGEQMAILEQQLTTVEQAITDYLRSPTDMERSQCIALIQHLEDTYGWKLAAEHERLWRTDLAATVQSISVQIEPQSGRMLDDGLLGRYEFTLRTVAGYLNETQTYLDVCNSGNMSKLGPMLDRLDERFIDCYRLLTDAAELLNDLTRGVKQLDTSNIPDANNRSSDGLETEELIWLKVLLDTQKNRLDAYTLEFKVHKSAWKHQADQWEAYSGALRQVKAVLCDLRSLECDVTRSSKDDIRKCITGALEQYNKLKTLAVAMLSHVPSSQSVCIDTLDSVASGVSSEHGQPAAAHIKDKLNNGKICSMTERQCSVVQFEVESVKKELSDVCTRHNCQHMLTDKAKETTHLQASPTIQVEEVVSMPSEQKSSANSTADWMNEEGLSGVLETLDIYRTDVEACLNGLIEEIRWLTDSSGLVPSSLVKRQSDDILLTNASRAKPTTAAELRLDVSFWHSGQTPSTDRGGSSQSVEFTPTWLKAKWAQLEALIEVTFAHEKQADAWHRESTRVMRLLRENEDLIRTNGNACAKVVARLESNCNKLSEALTVAQAALRRRKACLAGWQSDLVELDRLLAEIKSVMGSYDGIGLGIQGDTPSAWLADLRCKLSENTSPRNLTVEHVLAAFNPQNDSLGRYLVALSTSWNRVKEHLATPEQVMMRIRVPDHIATQIKSLLLEWDALQFMLTPPTVTTDSSTATTNAGVTATVVRAPGAWPAIVEVTSQSKPSVAVPSGSLTQATSPTLARMRHEVDQLSRWLSAVTQFAVHSKARLGDRFDQDTMNRQLQDAQVAMSEGSRITPAQFYHPAALQLKIQQFLTELNARRPQLDRIGVEKDRLVAWDSEEVLTAEFNAHAEHLPQLWDAAEKCMTQRTMELELMIAETQRLKELERDVDRWITKAELELDGLDSTRKLGSDSNVNSPRRLPVSPDTSRKRLQDLTENISTGRDKLNQYTRECQELITRFRTEDVSKLSADLEQITDRWNKFHERFSQTTNFIRTEASYDDLASDTEKVMSIKSRRTPSIERGTTAAKMSKLPEKLAHIEQKVTRISKMESDLQRQYMTSEESTSLADQRAKVLIELQALQTEITHLYNHISGGTANPSDSELSALPDTEMLVRLRQHRDKVTALRHGLQTSPSHNSLFLARLKELNDWVVHQDAAFRALVCPLSGNLLFIIKLREMVLNLLTEMESKRLVVEDALQQGRMQFEKEHTDTAHSLESEPDSDGSDTAHVAEVSPYTDEISKRTVRRIRRHLYHLRKRWVVLNDSILDYKLQLDSLSERLSNFHSLFNDTVEQVRSAHSVTIGWIAIPCLPFDRLSLALEQTQSFYEACAPLDVLLNNLDRQIGQFQDAQITIDSNVISQQVALHNDLDQIRALTEARIHELTQALASLQPIADTHNQSSSTLLRTPLSRNLMDVQTRSPQPELAGQAEVFTTHSESPAHLQTVPLSDSVSYPWERCVHPSGTQVPYYKNHATQDTQWDHPILCELMHSLKQLNVVRFADYRTALKLRKLQKTLSLDSLSISVLAENLKHIGHWQPIEGPNPGPFDRHVNVPQMIECLLQLFGGSEVSRTQGTKQSPMSLSPMKQVSETMDAELTSNTAEASSKCSTLPPTAKRVDPQEPFYQHASPTKCGRGFRRHTASMRQPMNPKDDPNARLMEASDVQGTGVGSKQINSGNRSASLPESVTEGTTSLSPYRLSMRRGRSSGKSKRRLIVHSPTKYPVNICVDLTLNWLLNVYDRMRKGNVRALSFKVALASLCMADLVDKYRYLFGLITDMNGYVTEQRLGALLYECILIPRNLGEGNWVGKEDFMNTVKICYNQVLEIAQGSETHQDTTGIQFRHFITWLRFGASKLAWLPLLHRVMLAEQVIHNVRCGFCQRQPLVGLRYRCLWCLNFDLCQQCFFSGRIARGHKLTHPMQEYCTHSTSGDSIRDFTRIVRNRLRSRDRLSRPMVGQGDINKSPGTTGVSRARGRCCDTSNFEEHKPRPAPVYGSDLASLIPTDQMATMAGEPQTNRGSFRTDSVESAVSPLIPNEPLISRPISSQCVTNPRGVLPPRAASDTRHLITDSKRLLRGIPSSSGPVRPMELVTHDEHQLIAYYTQELQQRSQPELNPPQPLITSIQSSVIPPIMDRSTISDGLPSAVTNLGPTLVSQGLGNLSLDRRQWSRTPAYIVYNGFSASTSDPIHPHGCQTTLDTAPVNRFEMQMPQRSIGQYTPYPLSSNPALHHVAQYNPYIPNGGVRRSYSLRARSQPPPEMSVHALRPAPSAHMESRSQWHPTMAPPSQVGWLNSSDQKMRLLEDERKALQLEYDRLCHIPNAYNIVMPRLHPTHQQRFVRAPLQAATAQPDYTRAVGTRTYGSRLPMHRPPSVGPTMPTGSVYTSVATLPGRFNYTGGLGRANNLSNGYSYGSEPRVALSSPYGPDLGPDMGPNQSISMAGGGGGEIANEARLLRAHRGRLELRMQQLEDQNKQLEQKLQRLRQYLVSGGTSALGNASMGSAGQISADLLNDRSNNCSKSTLRQRSASGGLAGQSHATDSKSYKGSGSVGQLRAPTQLESRQVRNKASKDNSQRVYSDTHPQPQTSHDINPTNTGAQPSTGNRVLHGVQSTGNKPESTRYEQSIRHSEA